MPARQFDLVTHWHVPAPPARVWAELNRPEDWPQWWRAVKSVTPIAPGDASGLGAVRYFTWTSALPYTLSFEMIATRIEPLEVLEGRARGELDGIGRWTLEPEPGGTHLRYDWQVALTKPWQVALAPLLRPAFAWNHNVVMRWGEQGLLGRLGRTANPRH